MSYIFFFSSFIAVVTIVVPAIINFVKDKKKSGTISRFVLLGVSVIGALWGFINSCTSKQDSVKNALIAAKNDSLYKNLLSMNLDSAKRIIVNQNVSLDSTKKVLKKSTDILSNQNSFEVLQKVSIKKLSDQIDTDKNILSLNRKFDKTQKEIYARTDRIFKETTGEDSLIIITPGFKKADSTLVFEIENLSSYQRNSVSIKYVDAIGFDSLKIKSNNGLLSDAEDAKIRFAKEINISGRTRKTLYSRTLRGKQGKFEFWFLVQWSNRIIRYDYTIILFNKKVYVTEKHLDFKTSKYFGIIKAGVPKYFTPPSKEIILLE
jgi:hypothetical protein